MLQTDNVTSVMQQEVTTEDGNQTGAIQMTRHTHNDITTYRTGALLSTVVTSKG